MYTEMAMETVDMNLFCWAVRFLEDLFFRSDFLIVNH